MRYARPAEPPGEIPPQVFVHHADRVQVEMVCPCCLAQLRVCLPGLEQPFDCPSCSMPLGMVLQ